MNVLHGEGVCAGVAGGKLHVLHRQTETPKRQISDPEGEIARFDAARERAIAQLAALEEETQERLGQEQALLFQIHQMMLEDLDYRESVTGIISGQLMNAEYAVDQTAAQFSQIFAQMDDAYMQQRASDVLDVSRRLISVLMGREEAGWAGDEPVILAADDLGSQRDGPPGPAAGSGLCNCPGHRQLTHGDFCPYYGHSRRGWPGRRPAPGL